ncbi:MAG: G5 domain-containing protein [Clostridia bacterium]|nr:G5 domain-containing protein [Clostridia bacterium]
MNISSMCNKLRQNNIAAKTKEFCQKHPAIVKAAGAFVVALVMMFSITASLRPVTIDDNGTVKTVLTLGRTESAVLSGAGIMLNPDDAVTSSLNGKDQHICIERAFDVSITVDNGDPKVLRMTGGTVADALKLAGVSSTSHDVTNLNHTDVLTGATNIYVEKTAYEKRIVTEPVPYLTTLRYSDTVPAGARVTERTGVNGEKTYVYHDYYENGKLVRSELVSETLTTQPVNEIAIIGNGADAVPPVALELNENGVPVKYKKVMQGIACAYTAKEGARTSTGTTPAIGTIAVNPKVIPYGTKLFVVSENGYVYGYGIASDTGGSLLKNKILVDLYMDTVDDCYAFGRRPVNVYILEE